MADHPATETRKLVWSGVFWNSLYQVFSTLLSFGAMLVLVRIIPPAEYGRWAAVVGILNLINSFNARYFIAQALQLPGNQEPDWSQHWSAGFFLHLGLTLLCQVVALCVWFIPDYRPLAPLLLLASMGLLVDWANQLGATMLRREMDFRSLRIVGAAGTLVSTAATLLLGVLGWGAFALVLGGNVIAGFPFAIYLVCVRHWRPRSGWWRWPKWFEYAPALRFGLQQMGSSLLFSARAGLESLVLPGSLGFGAMGLLNRSQALYGTTVGRVNSAFIETVYPLLPKSAEDAQRFARHAALFTQSVLLVALPGALFLGLEGPALSRLAYGRKWMAVDPLIWPGALFGLATTVSIISENVLLAANRLRACFLVNLFSAVVSLPAIVVAVTGGQVATYAWTLSAGQLVCATIALIVMVPFLGAEGVRRAVLPAAAGAVLATLPVIGSRMLFPDLAMSIRLFTNAALFSVVFVLSLRWLFPRELDEVLHRVPGGKLIRRWLGLSET